jgi:hypothetical protein
VKNIPTKLKQLAERRARVLGELNSYESLDQLADQISTLKAQLENLESLFLASTAKKDRLLVKLADIDSEFLKSYPSVKTGSIAPISGWKDKYGKRGSLKKFVYDTLKIRAPAFVPTNELAKLAIIEFSLVFQNSELRVKWYSNSLRGAIKNLSKNGLIEQSEEKRSEKKTGLSHWRLKEESCPTLASLRSDTHLSWRPSVDR